MRIVTIIILFTFLYSCSENKQVLVKPIKFTEIDSLSNLNELRGFLKKADSNLNDFLCIPPNSYNGYAKQLTQLKHRLDSMFPDVSFIKEDFDNNGYTDLITTGEYYQNSFKVIAIMSYGSQKYSVIPLSLYGLNFPIYPKLIYKNGLPVVELYSYEVFPDFLENGIAKKTLIYEYGIFIDYYENSEDYQISKIEFSTNGCHGACPVYDLKLSKDSKSIFRAKFYNFSKKRDVDNRNEEGNFEVMIKKENYNEICEIINYIQLKNRKDGYFTGGMHAPSSSLRVHFTDGTIKTINDHGMAGTNGLNFLYRKLSNLRFNQEWKKI